MVDDGGEVRRRRGKLDAADATYLRCVMRRYGWEKIDKEVEVCYWSECFPSACYGKRKKVFTLCLVFAHAVTASSQHACIASYAATSRSSMIQ